MERDGQTDRQNCYIK